MKTEVTTIDGYLPDKYGKYADPINKNNNHPKVSFPIKIIEIPKNTKTWALTFVDFDAVPVCGFVWIHWLAANIPSNIKYLPENASLNNEISMVQGSNSSAGKLIGQPDILQSHRYIGPTPPDKDHIYTLTIYALDTTLDLKDGYWLNDFLKKSENHIIKTNTLNIRSRS